MNVPRWMEEKDPVRLLLKLHEELGEMTHAFNRRQENHFMTELAHAEFIMGRLRIEVTKSGIPDTLPENQRVSH